MTDATLPVRILAQVFNVKPVEIATVDLEMEYERIDDGGITLRPDWDSFRRRIAGLHDDPTPVDGRTCYSDECGDPCQSKQALDRDEIAQLRQELGKVSQRLGKAKRWRDRYEALRQDVQRHDHEVPEPGCIEQILTDDRERGLA